MYYQSYEDYIRNILGYPVPTRNNYQNNTYNNYNDYEYIPNNIPSYSSDILDLYPEIYKIINPMVCKICEANSKPITRELVEQMTDEIYLNIEGNANLEENTVNVRVTVPSEKDSTKRIANIQDSGSSNRSGIEQSQVRQNRPTSSPINNLTQSKTSATQPRQSEKQSYQSMKQEAKPVNQQGKTEKQLRQTENEIAVPQKRQIRTNTTLRDLIKTLILNQLLGGRRPTYRPGRSRIPFMGATVQGMRHDDYRQPINSIDYKLM